MFTDEAVAVQELRQRDSLRRMGHRHYRPQDSVGRRCRRTPPACRGALRRRVHGGGERRRAHREAQGFDSAGQHGLRALAQKETARADLLARDSERFVKGIPFMVPLLALGMALGAYLIIWGVF